MNLPLLDIELPLGFMKGLVRLRDSRPSASPQAKCKFRWLEGACLINNKISKPCHLLKVTDIHGMPTFKTTIFLFA